MRIAGAAVRERRLRILDCVSRFMDAIHGEDEPVEILAARGFYILDFIDVIRRVTLVSRTERAGEICRDRVAIVVFQCAKRRRLRRIVRWSRALIGATAAGRRKCRCDDRARGEETKCGFHARGIL